MLSPEEINEWRFNQVETCCPYCDGQGFVWQIDGDENVWKDDCICAIAEPTQTTPSRILENINA